MAQIKCERDKGAEAGGASPTGVPQRISHAEMSQMHHSGDLTTTREANCGAFGTSRGTGRVDANLFGPAG